MQLSLAILSKKAIEAALKANWAEAICLNQQILEKNPENLEAKIRLGRAYIQTKKFDKAQKMFREVLKVDPINTMALKNLDLAKKGKYEVKGQVRIDTKSLLKEPGTTAEAFFEITAKGITAKDFVSGENLFPKIKKNSVDIYKIKKDDRILVGSIEDKDIVQKLNCAISMEAKVTAGYLKGREKEVTVLVKTSIPVFRSEKQDIRPYLKKGSLEEEPELEMEEEVVQE